MQEPVSGSSVLSRVASDLKAARTARDLSLDDASRILLIQKAHLEKIEAGDFFFFPGAYIFAYIKEYLREMELGDEALLDACRLELSVSTGLKRHAAPEGAYPEPPAPTALRVLLDALSGRRKAAFAMAGALLVLVVAAAAFTLLRSPEVPVAALPPAPAAEPASSPGVAVAAPVRTLTLPAPAGASEPASGEPLDTPALPAESD